MRFYQYYLQMTIVKEALKNAVEKRFFHIIDTEQIIPWISRMKVELGKKSQAQMQEVFRELKQEWRLQYTISHQYKK